MYKTIIAFILGFLFVACTDEDEAPKKMGCTTPATIRDLTGTDGCGFVFELEDGTRLEPIVIFRCGTPPVPKEQIEDPLSNFALKDGKKVMIDYQPIQAVSICMSGETVRITCISEVGSQQGPLTNTKL